MLTDEVRGLVEKAGFGSEQARDPGAHDANPEIWYNAVMSNILAAIGLGQLQVSDDGVRRRREIFETYLVGLGDLPGISFMPEPRRRRSNGWPTLILIAPDVVRTDRVAVRLSLGLGSGRVGKGLPEGPGIYGVRLGAKNRVGLGP